MVHQTAYRDLIVSRTGKLSAFLGPMLSSRGHGTADHAVSIAMARRMLTERNYDIVIMRCPLPDGTGLELGADICSRCSTAVLMIVSAETEREMADRARENGVYLLSGPVTEDELHRAVSWLETTRERMRGFERKTVSLEEKLSEIRLVNRAKARIMQKMGMSEEEAHAFILQRAMDLGKTKGEIARGLVEMYGG